MDNHMLLDKKERLFLSNQLEILKNQQIILNAIRGGKESDVDVSFYDNKIKALREGYELHYGDAFEDIYDGVSYEECRFVLDVLEMYRGITFSYLALQKDGKAKEKVMFEGFDLNTETEQYSYAKYLLFDLDRYDEIKEIAGKYYEFNSHTSSSIPKYKRQPAVWEEYKTLDNRYQMNEEQLNKILEA